jgi:hypothetical protein
MIWQGDLERERIENQRFLDQQEERRMNEEYETGQLLLQNLKNDEEELMNQVTFLLSANHTGLIIDSTRKRPAKRKEQMTLE